MGKRSKQQRGYGRFNLLRVKSFLKSYIRNLQVFGTRMWFEYLMTARLNQDNLEVSFERDL